MIACVDEAAFYLFPGVARIYVPSFKNSAPKEAFR